MLDTGAADNTSILQLSLRLYVNACRNQDRELAHDLLVIHRWLSHAVVTEHERLKQIYDLLSVEPAKVQR